MHIYDWHESIRDKVKPPMVMGHEFAGTIAKAAYRVTDEQVQGLRDVGWTDEQIAEGAYVAALFSMFVRLADTFDIEPPAVYEPTGIPAAAVRRD